MNPLLDPEAEKRFDAMLAQLDQAGYRWDGALCTAPDGYQFHGLLNSPFYRQVYKVWDYYQWRRAVESEGGAR